ncbi:MAG: hypothetical protein ABIN66_00005 [candidate division WOR-3 bacterium]
MGRNEKLRTLLRGLGMVVVVGVVGCEEALAPPNGWGPIDLNPNIDPDVDTTLFVDWGTRVDSTTDCVRLKTNFPDGYGGKIAVFGLDEDEIGNNYGDPPVFSKSCDPDDGATTEATIDDNGHAFLKATWLNEDCGHRPSDSLHPADSFRFKATVKNTSVEVRSPMVVFWKRVNFEVDFLKSAKWNPENPLEIYPPWSPQGQGVRVTHNLLHQYKTYPPDPPEIAPEADTACYAIGYVTAGLLGIEIDPDNPPAWYPIPDISLNYGSDFYAATYALLAEHRGTQLDTVYLFIADSMKGWNPNPENNQRVLGYCVFSREVVPAPMLIYLFARALRDTIKPATEDDYQIAVGMCTTHEVAHYLTGNVLALYGHNEACIMEHEKTAWLWKPAPDPDNKDYRHTYLCKTCATVMKAYFGNHYEIPLGVEPHKNAEEAIR